MIDFHSHILPGMDDGSRSVEESIELLHRESDQGAERVVLTPHFYAGRDSVEPFLKRRSEKLELLLDAARDDERVPDLHVGAEVYYFPDMGKADLLPKLCMEGTQILLVELPFCQWSREMYRDVRRIIEKQKLTVMLAHVDRYVDFQKKRDVWDEMFELPLYAQINAESFLNWKKRRRSLRLLKELPDVVLGSDCHNLERRPPNLMEGREEVRKRAGEKRLADIDELGKRILQG